MSMLASIFRINSLRTDFFLYGQELNSHSNMESEGVLNHLMALTLPVCTVFMLKVA